MARTVSMRPRRDREGHNHAAGLPPRWPVGAPGQSTDDGVSLGGACLQPSRGRRLAPPAVSHNLVGSGLLELTKAAHFRLFARVGQCAEKHSFPRHPKGSESTVTGLTAIRSAVFGNASQVLATGECRVFDRHSDGAHTPGWRHLGIEGRREGRSAMARHSRRVQPGRSPDHRLRANANDTQPAVQPHEAVTVHCRRHIRRRRRGGASCCS